MAGSRRKSFISRRGLAHDSLMPAFFRFILVIASLVAGSLSATEDRIHRVALFADEGAGEEDVETVTEQLRAGGIKVVHVTGDEIAGGILSEFDVVIFPGGSASAQSRALGEQGRTNVRDFVWDGNGYVGICAGAYLACSDFAWGVGVLAAGTVSPKWQRGEGMVEMEVTTAGADPTGLKPKVHDVHYENGPIIAPQRDSEIPPFETIAYFRSELAENDTPKGIMIDSPAIVRGYLGKGRVVVSSPHPERMDGSFIPAAVRWAAGVAVSAP